MRKLGNGSLRKREIGPLVADYQTPRVCYSAALS